MPILLDVFFLFQISPAKVGSFFSGFLTIKEQQKNIYQEPEEEAAYAKATGIWTQSLKGRFHRICCGLASKQDCFVTGLNKRVNWIQFLFLLTINISRFKKSQERKKLKWILKIIFFLQFWKQTTVRHTV